MSRVKRMAVAFMVTYWVVFLYSLALYWIGGGEFVRCEELEARLINGGVLSVSLGAVVALLVRMLNIREEE